VTALLLLGAWFGVSIPTALIVGAALHAGSAEGRPGAGAAAVAPATVSVQQLPPRVV
jgi:hypothetical protein